MLKDFQGTIHSIYAKIPPVDIETAKVHIRGAVRSFCKNNPDQEFSVRILFGGENKDWSDTPLQRIYDYYVKEGYSDAEKRAATDVGWLLKTVLHEDKYTYDHTVSGQIRVYIKANG